MSKLSEQPDFNPFATPSVVPDVNLAPSNIDLGHYASVRTGLQFIYYSAASLVLLFILVLIMFGLIAMYSVGQNPAGNSAMDTTAVIAALLFCVGVLGATVATLIGLCMCVASPNPNEMGFAITSVLSIFVYVGVAVLSAIFAGSGISSFAVSLLGTVACIVGTIAFCLLLKRIGANISSERLSKSAHAFMVWFILFIAVFFVGVIALIAGSVQGGMAGFTMFAIPFSLAVIVLGFGNLVQFLSMLKNGIHELKPRANA